MNSIPPPDLSASPDAALFLCADALLDGFGLDEGVVVPAEVLALLEDLQSDVGGALALVSGRTIADLDRIFEPLRLPCIGVHGSECRMADGRIRRVQCDTGFLDVARPIMRAFAAERQAVRLRDKGVDLALHTPRDQAVFREAADLVSWLASVSGSAYVAQEGTFVVDLKPVTAYLGSVIGSFLEEPPFRGRTPIVTWDSRADAGLFHAARIRGGISVSVGVEAAVTAYQLRDSRACLSWLRRAHVVT